MVCLSDLCIFHIEATVASRKTHELAAKQKLHYFPFNFYNKINNLLNKTIEHSTGDMYRLYVDCLRIKNQFQWYCAIPKAVA